VSLAGWLSFTLLTSPSLCARQFVSAHCWLAFFHCHDQFLTLRSSRGECPSLAGFLLPVHLLHWQGTGVHERGRGQAHGATTKDPN
jgi:hypothetical protein